MNQTERKDTPLNALSNPISKDHLHGLFAQVADDLLEVSNTLRIFEAVLSIESNDRELIAQSQINLNSLIRLCTRLQQENEKIETKENPSLE